MRDDRSFLLCVMCSVLLVLISIVNLKLYISWFAVGWRLGAVRLE